MTPNSVLSRKGGTSSKRDEYFGITNLVEHPAQLNPPGTAPVLGNFAVKLGTEHSKWLVLGGKNQHFTVRLKKKNHIFLFVSGAKSCQRYSGFMSVLPRFSSQWTVTHQ